MDALEDLADIAHMFHDVDGKGEVELPFERQGLAGGGQHHGRHAVARRMVEDNRLELDEMGICVARRLQRRDPESFALEDAAQHEGSRADLEYPGAWPQAAEIAVDQRAAEFGLARPDREERRKRRRRPGDDLADLVEQAIGLASRSREDAFIRSRRGDGIRSS
jgi:hypothetical protein